MKGSITVEAALVIPLVLLVVCSLMVLGVNYSEYVIEQSQFQLQEDRVAITGEVEAERYKANDESSQYINPKTVVRVADLVDDLTDMISLTSDLKKDYSDFFDGIITGF